MKLTEANFQWTLAKKYFFRWKHFVKVFYPQNLAVFDREIQQDSIKYRLLTCNTESAKKFSRYKKYFNVFFLKKLYFFISIANLFKNFRIGRTVNTKVQYVQTAKTDQTFFGIIFSTVYNKNKKFL